MYKFYSNHLKGQSLFLRIKATVLNLLLSFTLVYSQNTPFLSNPQANSAAAGGGVSMGRFQFSVPIYTIQVGEMSVPITLDYTGGSGIKTGDIASNVGLGWSLNIGGAVSSVPAGFAGNNFASENMYYFSTPTVGGKYFLGSLIPKIGGASISFNSSYAGFSKIKTAFNSNDHLQPMPTADTAKVIATEIHVSDKNNNFYKFAAEKTVARNNHHIEFAVGENAASTPKFDAYATSWVPKEFSNIEGIVSYNYDTIYTAHTAAVSSTFNRYVGGNSSYPLYSYADVNSVNYYNEELRIKSISFPLGKVNFIYNTQTRADYIGSHSLKKVTVENNKGEVIKSITLNYRYLIGNQSFREDSVAVDQYDNNFNTYDPNYNSLRQSTYRRLILNGINQEDANGNNMDLGYTFSYNNSIGLPSRLEAWTYDDYWGYYNGKNKDIQVAGDSIYYANGCADGDEVKGQQGMLSTVTFPGGAVRQHYFQRMYGSFLYPGSFSSGIIGGYLYGGYQDYDPVTMSSVAQVNYSYHNVVSALKPVSFSRFSISVPPDANPANANNCNSYQNFASLRSNMSFPLAGLLGPSYCFDSVEVYSNNAAAGHTTYVYKNYDVLAVNQFIDNTYVFNTYNGYNRWVYKDHFMPYNGYFELPADDWPEPNIDEAVMAVFGNNTLIGGLLNVKKYDDVDPGGATSFFDSFEGFIVDSIGKYGRTNYDENFSLCNPSRYSENIFYNVYAPTSLYYKITSSVENRKGGAHAIGEYTSFYPNTVDVPSQSGQNSLRYTYNVTTPEYKYQPIEIIQAEASIQYNRKIKSGVYYDRDFNTLRVKNILNLAVDSALNVMTDNFKFATGLPGDAGPPTSVANHPMPDPNGTEAQQRAYHWMHPGPDSRYDTTISFRWDPQFINLLEKKVKGQPKEVYIYGYSTGPYGKLLVAKITGNVTYEQAVTLIDQSLLNNAINYSDAAVRTELNKLRTGLPGAFVETYTYKPLIGVTSVTDARGRTVYSEYDNFNRLSITKDHEGNVLTKKCYSSYGREINCATGAPVN